MVPATMLLSGEPNSAAARIRARGVDTVAMPNCKLCGDALTEAAAAASIFAISFLPVRGRIDSARWQGIAATTAYRVKTTTPLAGITISAEAGMPCHAWPLAMTPVPLPAMSGLTRSGTRRY